MIFAMTVSYGFATLPSKTALCIEPPSSRIFSVTISHNTLLFCNNQLVKLKTVPKRKMMKHQISDF